ncbi:MULTISPECIES: hypothetical protein [unclassified Streptomyces]|uniref:hypothetical protein n=1 Tax=unclassified Streptomyces TaxID=2593676 RepID=UPI000AC84A4F|nr:MULTISPECIES: hypothetical protein [unclassified Streptomyces]
MIRPTAAETATALNTCRVLLTRGTYTPRIHAADPGTHHMLKQLIGLAILT